MNKLLMGCAIASALVGSTALASPNVASPLWPEGKIPMFKAGMPAEKVDTIRDDVVRLTNVSVPGVVATKVPNATKPTPVVVVCPGGGYGILAWNHEGVEVAQWLKDMGIAAVILKYRVPDQRPGALADAQRAIRWVRAHAKELNVDPARVGIMGFSAGANLTVRAATNWRKPCYEPIDDVDKESCRPDFQMPVYPWDLRVRNEPDNPWKGHHGWEISAEYPIDAETPRAFIVQTEDDFCQVETSLAYYAALKAAKVPAEMHLYEKGGHGGHGYGIRKLGFPSDGWVANAEKWLERVAAPARR